MRVERIPPAEFGHGRTRNRAARLARGRLLVFLVQDATPAGPDLLERLVAPLDGDPRVAGVFARQLARPEASPVERAFVEHTYPPQAAARPDAVFFSNVCSAIRRAVWEAIPFDDEIVMSEEQKWARERPRRRPSAGL